MTQTHTATFTRYVFDQIAYRTALICQQSGIAYRGSVTPYERAQVDAVTIREVVRPVRTAPAPPDLEQRAEALSGLAAGALVLLAFAAVAILAAWPFVG